MNSAPRGCAGKARRSRKENAGRRPAFGIGKKCFWLRAGEAPICREGTTPQDRIVSFAIRRVTLTMKLLLWLSEFNAVIEVRCLINESSDST